MKLYSFRYKAVPEEIPEKVRKQIKYSSEKEPAVEVMYEKYKSWKKRQKGETEEDGKKKKAKPEGYVSRKEFRKKQRDEHNKSALLSVPYEKTEVNESGEEVTENKEYLFDVTAKKKRFSAPFGVVYTEDNNKVLAITRSYLIPFILIILLTLTQGGYYAYKILGPVTPVQQGDFVPDIDENINRKQKDGDKVPERGDIQVQGFSEWKIPADRAEDLGIPLFNPAGNPCYFTFIITLDETGEELYHSKMVPPGEGIGSINFPHGFSAGEYPITIRVKTNKLDTGEELNDALLKVNMTVS